MIDVETFTTRDFEFARIEAELLEDRRVYVGDIMAVLDSVEADFVGCAMNDASFESPTCKPDGKTDRRGECNSKQWTRHCCGSGN